MKLKKETIFSSSSCSNVFRGCLLTLFLLTSFLTQAQVFEVVATDDEAAEVSVGAVDEASFRITRSPALTLPTTIRYTLTGTATSVDDFAAPLATGTVVMTFADPFIDVPITGIVDDNLIEGDETIIVTITLESGSGAIGLQDTATITLKDNDSQVTVTASDPIATEATPNTTDIGVFTIDLGAVNNTAAIVTVNYSIDAASTATPASDYGTPTGSAFIFPGFQTVDISIVPVDDLVPEDDETLSITLEPTSLPNSFIVTPGTSASLTIVDNDCAAGTSAPTFNSTPVDVCDVTSVNLNSYVTPVAPVGSTLRWSTNANPTLESQLLTTAAATMAPAGTYYAVFWDAANACASPPSVPLNITIGTTPTLGTATNAASCNTTAFGGTTTLDLDGTLSATTTTGGDWSYVSGPQNNVNFDGNTNVVNFNNRPDGNYIFQYSLASLPCGTAAQTVNVTITISDCDPCIAGNLAPAPANDAPDTDYCRDVSNNEIITLDLDDFTTTTPPTGTELKWSTVPNVSNENAHLSSSIINISSSGTYFGFFWDDGNNCASPALPVAILIKSIPVLTVGDDQVRCGPGTVALTASAMAGANNATINWYTSANGTTLAGTGQNFSPSIPQTTTYYVEATFNGCTTAPRIPVVATVVAQPSAGTAQNGGNASACSVQDNGPTILDLDDLIAGEDAGSWAFTSGPVGESLTIPSNNILDFENRSDGEYVFTYTTTGAQAPCVNETSVIAVSVNDCDVDTDLDGIFDGPEAVLGTNPNEPDTDGDGINDGEEVGPDIDNPLDGDEDGIIDALDSNILDEDMDGVVDQVDPANANPCIPNTLNGVCDSDDDGITDSDEETNGSDSLDPCDPDPENGACNAEVDLEILKSVDNLNALFGETVVFTITVNNITDSRASSIIVGDLLESGFEYVSHSPATEQYDPQTGEWAIPVIEAMGTSVLGITVNILEGGTYTNTAELLDVFQTDINADNNTATVTLPIVLPEGIDLILEKTALSANPLVGEEVIFTIKLTNASIDEAPVINIEVSDLIAADSGFVYVDANPAAGSTYDETTGIWLIESLAKNADISLEIRVSVPSEGTFTNTAEIRRSSPADGNPANNEASVAVKASLPTPADVGFVFNQFSPNGDGTNDVLRINRVETETNQEVPIIYNIQIFNRYGNLVFEGNNQTSSEVWDGTWKGKEAPDGTYFYTMSLDIGNGPQQKKGWIQLIR